jgi:hypothetical protein
MRSAAIAAPRSAAISPAYERNEDSGPVSADMSAASRLSAVVPAPP